MDESSILRRRGLQVGKQMRLRLDAGLRGCVGWRCRGTCVLHVCALIRLSACSSDGTRHFETLLPAHSAAPQTEWPARLVMVPFRVWGVLWWFYGLSVIVWELVSVCKCLCSFSQHHRSLMIKTALDKQVGAHVRFVACGCSFLSRLL